MLLIEEGWIEGKEWEKDKGGCLLKWWSWWPSPKYWRLTWACAGSDDKICKYLTCEQKLARRQFSPNTRSEIYNEMMNKQCRPLVLTLSWDLERICFSRGKCPGMFFWECSDVRMGNFWRVFFKGRGFFLTGKCPRRMSGGVVRGVYPDPSCRITSLYVYSVCDVAILVSTQTDRQTASHSSLSVKQNKAVRKSAKLRWWAE